MVLRFVHINTRLARSSSHRIVETPMKTPSVVRFCSSAICICGGNPPETEWYEVEITAENLANVRMFPRAQWRKVANGRFSTLEIAEGMRNRQDRLDAAFVTKIQAIGRRFDVEDPELGAVLLIGISETEPLTVLDGNHRLMAAMLRSPGSTQKLRFICGLSPRMTECCWYRTNLMTLFRYAKNVLTHSSRNPAAELARLL